MDLAKSETSERAGNHFEDSLRTVDEYKISKNLQSIQLQELIDVILANKEKTERVGFEPTVE